MHYRDWTFRHQGEGATFEEAPEQRELEKRAVQGTSMSPTPESGPYMTSHIT
jgi:hypothetical protein